MNKSISRLAQFLLCLALELAASGCTCNEPKPIAEPATGEVPSVSPSAAPACVALPPIEAWRSVGADFFDARLPTSFRETGLEGGKGYRDDAAKRRVQFSQIDLPVGPLDITAAVNELNRGVREQAKDPALGLKLGPTLHGGTDQEPVRYYVVTENDRTFVQGLVGRKLASGRAHAVLVIYEDEGAAATPACMMADGKRILETISLANAASSAAAASAAASASGSAGPVAPSAPLRITPRAIGELRRQLKPGETVWVGVTVAGAEVSFSLDVGKDVPPNVDMVEIEGVPVALDKLSLPFLRGVSLDFLPGRGFLLGADRLKSGCLGDHG